MAQGKSQLEERRAILHQKGNHVACPDSLRRQPARRRLDAAHHFRVANLVSAVDQRQPFGRALGVELNEARKGNHCLSQPWIWRWPRLWRGENGAPLLRPGRLAGEVSRICPAKASRWRPAYNAGASDPAASVNGRFGDRSRGSTGRYIEALVCGDGGRPLLL